MADVSDLMTIFNNLNLLSKDQFSSFNFKVKLLMEVGQIGETGAHVSVIIALEQEHGIKLDLARAHLPIAMEG